MRCCGGAQDNYAWQSVFILSVRSISFVWLNETNQMNQINQINKTNQTLPPVAPVAWSIVAWAEKDVRA
jgi:hypothetical protein